MEQLRIEDAISFMNEIRQRFANDEQRYRDFLNVMIEMKENGPENGSCLQRISWIFEGYEDLLQKFQKFLPSDIGFDVTKSQQVVTPAPQTVVFQNVLPDNVGMQQEANQYISSINERFNKEGDDTYARFMQVLKEYQEGRKDIKSVVQEIAELFRGHDDLINRFLLFIPNEYQYEATIMINQMNQNLSRPPIPAYVPATPIAPPQMESPEYTASRRRGANTSMRRSVVPSAPAVPSAPSTLMTRSRRRQAVKPSEEEVASIPDDDSRFFEQIRRSIPSDEVYTQFIKLLDLYNRDILPLNELFAAVTDLLHIRHPAVSHLRNYLAQKGINEDEMVCPTVPLSWEQIHACKGPTPSYHELPPQVPRRVGSQRSYADSLVLNDDLVSQTIGSEDLSYIHMRRNQYEEALFRCEDDRFEVDVILETTRSAIAQLHLLLEELEALQEEEQASYRLQEGALSAIQIAAIRRVYAQNGMDQEVMKLLFLNPHDCIPRIIERLEKKEKEWMGEKVIMNERCREIQKQNYYLSLDHRSFYFRQTDKKNITTKVLIDTIKDLAAKQANAGADDAHKANHTNHTHKVNHTSHTNAAEDPSKDDSEKVKQEGAESSEEEEGDKADSGALNYDLEKGRLDGGEAHLQYTFPNRAVHKQVIRLLLVAGKRQFTRSEMKRFRALLQDLVISFFQLTPNFIASAEIENSGVQYAVGTAVSTPKGPGVIASFDSVSKLYTITFPDGESQFPRGEILVQPKTDTDSESEEGDSPGREPSVSVKHDPVLETEDDAPVQIETDEPPLPASVDLLYGSNSLYVFYRLYALLYERLERGISLCHQDVYTEQRMTAHAVERAVDQPKERVMRSSLERNIDLMDVLIQLIRGEVTNANFEQRCRELLGTNGYFLFTMDRVTIGCVRQIQSLMNDSTGLQLIALRNYEKQRGGLRLNLYRNNALRILGDARLHLFRMEYDDATGLLKFWYVGLAHDLQRPVGALGADFHEYAENYMRHVEEEGEEEEKDESSPFLTRSKAKSLSDGRVKMDVEMEKMEEGGDDFVPEQGGSEEEVPQRKRAREDEEEDENDLVASKKSKE